jgi:glutamate/tyrosine decarboxylase-like PLP-dependent enzyme
MRTFKEVLDEPHGRARDSSLDIGEGELRALSDQFAALTESYFASVSDRPVFPQTTGAALEAQLDAAPPAAGQPLSQLAADCQMIIDGSRHNGHPRFFGYVASPSTPPGAFADLLASALNASVTSWRSAPAATQIERTVIRWLGSLIGYDDDAQGLLTSGGSMANLTALLMAHRVKAGSGVSQTGISGPRMMIYASDQVHFSIVKAADILGLGKESVRLLPTSSEFSLDVTLLRDAVQSDLAKGLRPFCVVASAGTAATGAIDPLDELARVAEEFKLWFHIDGAYGAPAAMTGKRRARFSGLERADSVSLDPHKWLYTPLDCGCLLYRDATLARQAFVTEADYVKVHEQAELESFAFWDYGIELSRRFRSLKVWLTLKYYGTNRLAAAIADDIAMAEYMGQRVRDAKDLELLAPVELSICCFRYVPGEMRDRLTAARDSERQSLEAELNRLNERIMQRVQRGGEAYLSNAMLRGRFALRACIINFRTTHADIDLTLKVVRDAAMEVEAEN